MRGVAQTSGMTVLRPALAYFTAIFALAFGLGVLRQTIVAPALGEMLAVAAELPVVLVASWWWAGRVLRRWPLPRAVQRLAMGAVAFAILMAAELALAMSLGGQDARSWLSSRVQPAGALGLAGQALFALIPWLRGSRSV